MPLQLGSLNRRRFLSASIGAGAGWLAQGFATAASVPAKPGSTFSLLSDTHVAGDLGTVIRGCCMANNLQRAVAEIAERDAGDAGVFVNGDCAHLFGKSADYRSFASLIDPLATSPRNVHLLLGNHDNHAKFARACGGPSPDQLPVAGKHVGLVESVHANWFLLDSLREGPRDRGRDRRKAARLAFCHAPNPC